MTIDKIVAAAAGMASTLYLMAACVAWARVIFLPYPKAVVERVIFDRAPAWSALSVLFGVVSAVKLGVFSWADPIVDMALVLTSMVVFVSGLVSVRAITIAAFGMKALIVFAFVSLAVGLAILFS